MYFPLGALLPDGFGHFFMAVLLKCAFDLLMLEADDLRYRSDRFLKL